MGADSITVLLGLIIRHERYTIPELTRGNDMNEEYYLLERYQGVATA